MRLTFLESSANLRHFRLRLWTSQRNFRSLPAFPVVDRRRTATVSSCLEWQETHLDLSFPGWSIRASEWVYNGVKVSGQHRGYREPHHDLFMDLVLFLPQTKHQSAQTMTAFYIVSFPNHFHLLSTQWRPLVWDLHSNAFQHTEHRQCRAFSEQPIQICLSRMLFCWNNLIFLAVFLPLFLLCSQLFFRTLDHRQLPVQFQPHHLRCLSSPWFELIHPSLGQY